MAELIEKSSTDDLAILQPEEKFVEVNGTNIYVKPFTFGKLLKALKHLSAIFGTLEKLQHAETLSLEQAFLDLIGSHEDDVLNLISFSTGQSLDFFEDLDAVKGLDLAVLTYEVNQDFFVQHLVPKLQNLFPSDSQEDQMNSETTETAVETKAKAKKTGSTSSKS